MQKARTLFFTGPRQIEVCETNLPAIRSDEALVETVISAVSTGTEMLIYRGQFPRDLVDSRDDVSSALHYPLAYGYACVGIIRETGQAVNKEWLDRLVFSFQPHTSHFVAGINALIPIPNPIPAEAACFLANMETAVNLVQDAAPILGERALVLGQGVIGLLAAALLGEFPLETLVSADHFALRRGVSPAHHSLDSSSANFHAQARAMLEPGADLTLECTGNPSALNDAIALTAFSGRVLIGSWYGQKQTAIDLGGAFHRSRIKVISSQVSTIAPELSGRWDKTRRFHVAWNALERIQPQKWITHRFPIGEAGKAFELLDKSPQETILIVFDYTQ
jgi:2-desacetyl-2-hydroxyethyl bacteriochlorophyllide A dehydrogenase